MTTAPARTSPPDGVSAHHDHSTFRDLRDDVSRLGVDARRGAGEAAHAGLHAARQGALHAIEAGERAVSTARSAHQKMVQFVASNPATSVLIAVGVGALVARLIPRE